MTHANQGMKKILIATSQERLSESAIDATLQDSFPASDPPSWTLGIETEKGHVISSPEDEGEGKPETS